MVEMLKEMKVFHNEFGTISLQKVSLIKINKVFNFKDVAYIDMKRYHIFLLYKKYYLKVTLTNATTIHFQVKKNELTKARQFIRAFSNFSCFYTEII